MLAAISYDPLVSIDLGPLSVSPHGIFTGVGVVVGAWFLLRDVRRAGFDADVVTSILTRAVVAALVGARLAYVVNHWSRFDSVFEILRLWEGGASLLGGLTAALVVAVVELRRRRMPVLVWCGGFGGGPAGPAWRSVSPACSTGWAGSCWTVSGPMRSGSV